MKIKPFTLCEYSAKNTTRLTTSTQKTPITTTLSTSKTKTTASTTIKPTTKYTNTRKPTRLQTTTEQISETTTMINPLGKDPRFGDNNITESETPDDGKMATTSVGSLITAITDTATTEETTFTTEYDSTERTTFSVIPGDHNTKRPRVETTLEVEDNWNISASTEPMETSTNIVLTVIDETTDIDHTTVNVSVSKTVHKSCKSKKDCGTNEICMKKECFKVCETNGNVTKLSDDCVKGTSENNFFFMITHFSYIIYTK